MKKITLLDYTFMYDPSEIPWTTGNQFELNLGVFFKGQGYDIQFVDTVGNSNKRVLYITQTEQAPPIHGKAMTFKKPTGVK